MLLLDTCTLLWLAADRESLSDPARAAITANAGALYVSAVSGFEIGAMQQAGRIELPRSPARWFEEVLAFHGLREIPMTGALAAAAGLAPDRADLCDRVLVATALAHDLTILSPDPRLREFEGVRIHW